jgi:hypothetical protein
MEKRFEVAKLNQEQLAKVRELESALGTWVVAVEPKFQLADLTDEQLKALQAAERELGVVLLAYKAS